MSKRNKLSCGGKCGHTKAQHRAFDRGYWISRRAKTSTVKNPFNSETESAEWEAFESGASAERCNR